MKVKDILISRGSCWKYDLTATFNATDKYNGCSAKETITIEDGTSDSTLPLKVIPLQTLQCTIMSVHLQVLLNQLQHKHIMILECLL